VISAKKEIADDEFLSHKVVLDALTGSSANGAVPSASVQSFTRPSGNGTYTAPANETPLDDTFRDARASYTLGWDKPFDRLNRGLFSTGLSKEYDFTSVFGSATWLRDTSSKNTTWSAGINLELDSIDPVGGAPEPLTDMLDELKDDGTETRNVTDLLFGVTQVIDRTSLVQVNLSLTAVDGYQTDPYKLVSVVDAGGDPVRHLFENRPDSRARQSLFAKYRKILANDDIVTLSWRYATDDWEVDSNTIDLSYRWRLGEDTYLQPHLRWYSQSAAEFYRYFLTDGDPLPEFASADYRLGEMTATTIGVKYGSERDGSHAWSIRAEYYLQTGDGSPDEAIGQLRQQDLYPDVEAFILQFNYDFNW